MKKKTIYTPKAPKAIGPYNQAVIHSGMVYCSGQIALIPDSMKIIEGDAGAQTRQVMKNLEAVLKEAGSSLDKVLRCTIFLDNMDDFTSVNEVYGTYFSDEPPARETVAVQTLPKHALVEISCIAFI